MRKSCLTACVFIFFFVLSSTNLTSQLSNEAKISLLTCGPGEDLYSIFGHTALHVRDPVHGLDEVYNYGSFDYEDPDFLLNFLKGKLTYWVGKESFQHFVGQYRYLDRFVKEEVINLDFGQKNVVYAALVENHKIANRYYLYDFLFDNCSTRINDIIEKQIGPFQFSEIDAYSFRDGFLQKYDDRCQMKFSFDQMPF